MVKVTIISPEAKSGSVWRLKREIDKIAKCDIFLLSSNSYILDDNFNLECDVIHSRCSIGFYNGKLTLFSWQFLNSLELEDYLFINPLDTIYLTSDKFKSIKLLSKYFLTPKTALIRDYDDAVKFMEKYNLNFPIIIKSCFSKCGERVFKILNHKELYNICKNALHDSLIIQEYINFERNGIFKDIRLLAINDNNIFGYSRVSKDFRTNIHLGGKSEKINIDEELKEIAFKCLALTNATILGIDILPTDEGYYLLELNSAPGTSGFYSLGLNVDMYIANAIVKSYKR